MLNIKKINKYKNLVCYNKLNIIIIVINIYLCLFKLVDMLGLKGLLNELELDHFN